MTIELFTVTELAKLLQCEEQAAAKALNDGRLPGLKLGRGWVIPKAALEVRMTELALEESMRRRTSCSLRAIASAPPLPKRPPEPKFQGRRRVPPKLPQICAEDVDGSGQLRPAGLASNSPGRPTNEV